MSGIEEVPTPLKIKTSGVIDKFDGEGTDPANLVERVHVEDDENGGWKVVKVEFFDGADNKIGEDNFEEGGTT